MKFLFAVLMLSPVLAQAGNYKCRFNADEGNGTVNIYVKNKFATINLNFQQSVQTYRGCDATKDDFGLLIDCNSGNLDFMILLNNEVSPASGGIMSSTHELFVDINC